MTAPRKRQSSSLLSEGESSSRENLSIKVRILVADTQVCEVNLDEPLQLGRQRTKEPPPYHLVPAKGNEPARLIIALQEEKDHVSRQHLTLTPLDDGLVRISNDSKAVLALDDGKLLPAETADRMPPFHLALPGHTIAVALPASSDRHGIHSLHEPTRGPGSAGDLSFNSRSLALLQPGQMRVLLEGVSRALGVLQSAVGANDFLDRASHALVQIVGLDTGRVLRLEGQDWRTAAVHGTAADPAWRPSRHVMDRLLRDRSTVWQKPHPSSDPDAASLRLLDTVVAAPLLDRHSRVIGALYGERRKDAPMSHRLDTQVSALLVDLLAGGVATGLARLEQENAALRAAEQALRATALFEQFFSRDLALQLAADPGMLDGREAAVTVLFADVRSFSKYSEKLGAAVTVRFINDVLGALSDCVHREGGVLVDYIGDELMAMFGAPSPQPDQAERAVRAALAMQQSLAALDDRWQAVLGESLSIGVGINSGNAQVGNTGSHLKFKYGPLGNSVNLASRVQGLTKYLRCDILVTADTQRALGGDFVARRVVRARAVNIETPIDLYQVDQVGNPEQQAFFAESQAALEALEAGGFAQAARMAGALLANHPGDGPVLLVLARAAQALVQGSFDPVWVPPGK